MLDIPHRSILRSAPLSGGVKGADLVDDEPDGVEDDVFVASFPVTSRGWPIGAPAALTGFIQSQLQQHPWWRMPAGHGLRLQPDLAAATITAYRRQMVKASGGKAGEKEGGEKGGGGRKNRGKKRRDRGKANGQQGQKGKTGKKGD